MKSHPKFKRRFSLQPASFKEGQDDPPNRTSRHERLSEADSGRKVPESSVKHKIVVMGAPKTGKTAIINQFLYNEIPPKYKRTVEDLYSEKFYVSGIQLTLDILDTSGSHEFPAMRDLHIQSADAFILVYDVNDKNTFTELEALRQQIIEKKGENVPIVVVGNKIDLSEDVREVETERTREIVTVDWSNGFAEVSAKNDLEISTVFKELLSQAKVKYNLSPALQRRRRQSLPPPQHLNSRTSSAQVPTAAQLQHLQKISERSDSKRNSCILS